MPSLILRKKAEALWRERQKDAVPRGLLLDEDGVQRLIRDLGVRQIELELQQQKLAELTEALRANEKYIRSIGNNLVGGMVYQLLRRKDGSRQFTYLSDGVRKMFGVTAREGMRDARLIYRRVHPGDRARVRSEEEAAHRSLRVFTTEARMIDTRGRIRWSRFVSKPTRLSDGTTRWDGIAYDITAQKTAAAALNETSSLLRSTLDSTADGILVVDRRGRITAANRQFIGMSGIPAGLFAKNDDAALLAFIREKVADPKAFLARIRRLYARPSLDSFDKVVFKDGRIFERYSHPHYLDGKIVGRVWNFRDVTARARADDRRAESEARYWGLFRHMSSAVAVYAPAPGGRDFIVRECNDALLRIEGLARSAVVGKRLCAVFPGVKRFGLFAVLRRVHRTRRPERFPLGLYKDRRIVGWRDNYVFALPSGEVVAVYDDVTGRKAADEALRRSEEKHRTVIETALDGFWHIDTRGRFLEVNRAACRMLGYAKKELLAMSIRDIEALEHPREVIRRIARMRRTGGERFETRHRRKDGRVIDVEVTTTFRTGPDGAERLFVFVRDITAKKKALERLTFLRQRERHLAHLLEHAEQPFGCGYPDGRLGLVNRAFTKLTGYTREELATVSWNKTLTPKRWLKTESAVLERLIRTGGSVRYEKEYRRKDGSLVPIELLVHLVRDERGRPAYFYSFLTDITERKQAERELRDTAARFRAIFDTSSDGILIADLKTYRFFLWNRAMAAMLGRDDGELRQMRVDDIHPAAALPRVRRDFGRLARGAIRVAIDVPVLRKDGATIPVDITASPVVLGGTTYLLGMFRDVTERKLAEEEIAAGYRKWQATFDAIGEAIALLGPDRTILQCNRAFLDLAKSPRSRVIGRTCWAVIHGSRRPISGCPVGRMMKSGKRESLIIRRADRYLEVTADPILNAHGRLIGAVHIVADITARKEAELSIRASEERFRRFALASGYGFAIGELDGRLLFGNPAVCRIVEVKGEGDFTRRRFYRYYSRRDAERLRREILPAVLRKGQWVGELPLRTVGGKTVRTEQNIFLIRDASGEARMLGNIITDITRRRELEEERDRLFNYSIDMFCVAGFDGRFKMMNPAWDSVLGWGRQTMMARPFMSFVHPDDRAATAEVVRALARGEPMIGFRNRYLRKDGSCRWLSWNAFPLMAEKRIFAVARDVTDEQQLEETRRQLTRAVSHELKTPIGMSKMAIEMFADAYARGDTDRVRYAQGIIARNLDRLDKDVESILDLFLIESSVTFGRRSRFSVSPLVVDIVKRFRPMAEMKGLWLRAVCPRGADTVLASRVEIRTVVRNLVDNALKFTVKGGVTIRVVRRRTVVEIVVADTGIGIAPADRRRVFQRYFKGHQSMPGAGLGLVICQDILKRYGGAIAVRSPGVGKGTEVVVTLPTARK